jgi:hypothetical protein
MDTSDGAGLALKEHSKIEKRNDDGELYEVVAFEHGTDGQTKMKVIYRKEGLAPREAYAWDIPLDEEKE